MLYSHDNLNISITDSINNPMKKKVNSSFQTLQAYLQGLLDTDDSKNTIAALVDQRLNMLRVLFTLPAAGTDQLVLGFVRHYIASAPKHLSAFQALAEMTGCDSYTQPFLDTAQQFFFEPHPVSDAESGLHALLCKAYLFHRMMEELNDRITLERQLPLAPIDMAHANLVAHTLIGDEQANLLDQTVLIQLELINVGSADKAKQLFQQTSVKATTLELKNKGWQAVLERWPFLGDDLSGVFE
ncbi:MAG: hypothetical protein ACI9D5_001607 [Candidatus Endobugula sp.]|jgi:hypothetical protein